MILGSKQSEPHKLRNPLFSIQETLISAWLKQTISNKTNQLARKSIIAYARKYLFKHENANGNKGKKSIS